MLPFLLSREDLPSGFTRFVYDAGPDKRATVVVRTIDVPEYLRTFDPTHLARQLQHPAKRDKGQDTTTP